MKLTVIGCYGAYPPADGATSGYLVEEKDTKVLLDCGSGVLAKLQQVIPLYELDAVVLTHYHPDHCADLGCLQYAVMIDRKLGRRDKPFCAWGPGSVETLAYEEYCEGRSYEENRTFQVGCLTFEVAANLHEVRGYAIGVTSPEGVKLVYSGDTAYYGGLASFAKDADCFLCESSFYRGEQDRPPAQHLTSLEAARLAAEARAKLLVLTHLPHFGEPEQLADEAASVYSGRVLLARQGLVLSFPFCRPFFNHIAGAKEHEL